VKFLYKLRQHSKRDLIHPQRFLCIVVMLLSYAGLLSYAQAQAQQSPTSPNRPGSGLSNRLRPNQQNNQQQNQFGQQGRNNQQGNARFGNQGGGLGGRLGGNAGDRTAAQPPAEEDGPAVPCPRPS
jgi:hypothetical protein